MAVDLHLSSQVLVDLMATEGVGNWDIGAFMWVLRHTGPNGVFENRVETLMMRDRSVIPKSRVQKMVTRLRDIGLIRPLTFRPYRRGEYVVWPMAGGRAAKMGHAAPLMVEWVKLWESAIEHAADGEPGGENGANAGSSRTDRKIGELSNRPGKGPGVFGIGGRSGLGSGKKNSESKQFPPKRGSKVPDAPGLLPSGDGEPAAAIEDGAADYFVGQFNAGSPFTDGEQPYSGGSEAVGSPAVQVVTRRASWSRRK